MQQARKIWANEGPAGILERVTEAMKAGHGKAIREAAMYLGLPAAAIAALEKSDDK